MKRFIAICLCAASIPLLAQTELETFTSPDRDFHFKHSPALIHCTRAARGPDANAGRVDEPRISQDDLCDEDATVSATIICLAYPKDKFKDKPQFIAAVFFARLIPAATTQKACLDSAQAWLVHDSRATIINGISARLFHTSDAWLSGSESGEIYRVFHSDKCYELGIQEAEASTGGLDPVTFQDYTAQDAAAVDAALQEPLHSFTFLK
jgi:hypothetical protein